MNQRVLRMVRIAGIAVAAFLVSVVAVLAILLGTHFGLSGVASMAGWLGSRAIHGSVSIGSVEGSIFSNFTFHDVVVKDSDAHDVIKLQHVRVVYEFSALFKRQFHATELEVGAPWVRLETHADGKTNIQRLFAPDAKQPPTEPSGPTSFTITVDRFQLERGAFLTGPEQTAERIVDEVQASLSLVAPLPNFAVEIRSLAAHSGAANLSARLTGRAALDGDVMIAEPLVITVEDHEVLRVLTAKFNTATTALKAQLELDVPASLSAKLTGLPDLVLAVTGKATVDGSLDALTGNITLAATRVTKGNLSLAKLNVVADIHGASTALSGKVHVRGKSIVADGQHFGDADFVVDFSDSAKHLVILGGVTGGRELALPELRAQITLKETSTIIAVEALRVITRGVEWSGRDMQVDVHDDGSMDLQRVHLASKSGTLSASGTIAPEALLSKSHHALVRAKGIRLAVFSKIVPGVPRLGGILNLELKLDGTNLGLLVRGKDVTTEGVAPLALAAEMTLEGVKLRSTAKLDGGALGHATIQLAATTPTDPLDTTAWKRRLLHRFSNIDVVLAELNLAELGRILRTPVLQKGQVNAQLKTEERGNRIEVDAQVKGVRLAHFKQTIDATLSGMANATNTAAQFEARLGNRRVVFLQADLGTGLEDIEHKGMDALEKADGRIEIKLDEFSLSDVQTVMTAPPEPPSLALRGVMTGDAMIDKRGRDIRAQIDLRAEKVQVRSAPAFDGRLTLNLEGRALEAEISIEGPSEMHVAARTRVVAPANVLDLKAWQRMDLDEIREVTANIKNGKLGVAAAVADIDLPPGELELALRLATGLSSPELDVTLRGVQLNPSIAELGATLSLREQQGDTLAEMGVLANQRHVLLGNIGWKGTLRQIVEGGTDAFLAGPLVGTIKSIAFDIHSFLAGKRLQDRYAGILNLTVDLDGTLKRPKANVALKIKDARLGGQALTRFDVDAIMAPGQIELQANATQVDGGTMRLDAELTKTLVIDFTAKDFVVDFLGDIEQMRGGSSFGLEHSRLDADIHTSGTFGAPKPQGRLTLTADRMALAPGVPSLEKATVSVVMDGGKVDAKVVSKAAGGDITLNAKATVFPWSAFEFDANLLTHEVKLAAGSATARASLDVRATGKRTDGVLEIDAVSREGRIKFSDGSGGGNLLPVNALGDVVYVDAAGVAADWQRKQKMEKENLNIVVHVRTDKGISIEGEEMRTALEAELDARSTPEGFAVDGAVWLSYGKITVIAHQYDVERARVAFDGQVPVNPRLDILLSKSFDNATFKVQVSGTAKNPELVFSSDPPSYTRGELMQVFLGGDPGAESSGNVTRNSALTAATGLLLDPLTRVLRRSLPIDTMKIDVSEGAAGTTNAALVVGKWITDDLFVAYSYKLVTDAPQTGNTSEGVLRYRFTAAWIGELKYEQGQKGSAEILWVKRF